MEWEVSWGDTLPFLIGLAKGGDCPKALEERPDLFPWLEPVIDAFWQLQGDRGMSPSGRYMMIPFASIDVWARRNQYDDDASFGWLLERLTGLDKAFLALMNELSER